MLPLFCLRLSLGLLAALLVLPPALIHPRFYRTHLLIVLALCSIALVSTSAPDAFPLRVLVALGLAFLGTIVWSTEGAPVGRLILIVTMIPLVLELLLTPHDKQGVYWAAADDLTSALLLGIVLTAMLLGHSYLINPSMSLAPLKRLLLSLGLALLARAIVAGVSIWLWTASVSRLSLSDVALMWLPLRWGLGLIVPAVLGFLAWRTTLLRNTQSSTGILYVTVVFVFLGELTAQLLFNVTGYAL